jgi:DNA-binding response OmpR family regulator
VSQKVRPDFICALLVGAEPESRLMLHNVFRDAGWRLYQASDRKQALGYLEQKLVQVVIANADVPGWPWKRALQDLRGMARPPQLVVTSRTADEFLWAEVLNWGAYDVLVQPLRREEVERVVASAGRHFDVFRDPFGRAQAAAS